MTLSATFLSGAKDRLLPASLPFRFFASAAGFHVLAWLALIFGADEFPTYTGGSGAVLASLHLLTLGVLSMTAMGASLQLLPVATRQPIVRKWPIRLSFWLFMPATLILAWGMFEVSTTALYLGGAGVTAGFVVFALLTAENLRRARSAMPIVSAHTWAALIALAGLVILGLILIYDFDTGMLIDRQSVSLMHMVIAIFGFMGLLVFGFSQVLIPMFVLSRTLPAWLGWLELALAVTAIILAIIGIQIENQIVMAGAIAIGIFAAIAYFGLMRSALQTSMRKRLGLSFVLIRMSWFLLMLALLVGIIVMAGVPIPNGATLFGFLLLAGWLLTFLMGILQRIMPFLASMHVIGKGGRPPLLSELTAERPLQIHAACHFAALVVCSAGIVSDSALIVRLGALLGLAGAIAFAFFAGFVVTRLRNTGH